MKKRVAGRLRDYAQAASTLGSFAVLGVVWLAVMQVFLGHMVPRIAGIFRHVPLANTPPCDAVQCDFSVFWPAGLLARMGRYGDLYNPLAFDVFRQHVLFAGEARLDWIYPPPSLLPVLLISYFPFGFSFILWVVALMLLGVLVLRWAGLSWAAIVISLLSPAALWDVEMGQWEFFCGAVLVAGILLQSRSEKSGGALLSLMIFKPQIAFLVPFGLLAGRRWGVMMGGALAGLFILALTTVWLGPSVWRGWLSFGVQNTHQNLIQGHPIGLEESISVFWMMRNFGAGVSLAYAVQIAAACGAAWAVWMAWQAKALNDVERMALTVFCGLLFTPYAFIVDMVAYEIALTLLAEQRRWRIDLLDVLFWLWPMLSPALYIWKGWLLTPVIVAIAIARTWQRAGMPVVHLPKGAAVLPRA